MLKIGEFSRLSRVSIRMLRHYDEIGLLQPARLDPQTGYRYYNEEQLLIAGRVAALRDMGFSFSAIREIVRDDGRETLAAETVRRLQLLDVTLDRVRKDEDATKYDVTLKIHEIVPSCHHACNEDEHSVFNLRKATLFYSAFCAMLTQNVRISTWI